MIKKITVLSTTIALGLGSVFAIPSVKAESYLTVTQGQRSGIQAGIIKANVDISQFQAQIVKLNEQISRVEQAISDNNKMIVDTQENIKASQAEIQQLQKEVAAIKERIAKRNEILKKRAQSIQESGSSVSYLDVLLGASSFSDFIDRFGAVATIVESDRNILKQHEADKQEVEKKQELVEKKLADLNYTKTELQGMQEHILDQKAQNDALKAKLQKEQKEKIAEKASLKQQDRNLASTKNQIQQPSPVSKGKSSIGNKNKSLAATEKVSIPVVVSSPKTNGSAKEIITAGYKYFGNSVYVFGGGRTASDIARGRFDCSGFVNWAFAQGGYNIGSSTDTLKNQGTRVSVSEMRPGDLVFFDTYKIDGHVGIYMGGGKFIGSQSSTGVAIADMTRGYWKQKFNGRVQRILN